MPLRKVLSALTLLLAILVAVTIFSFPLLAMFFGSFKPNNEIITLSPQFFPRRFTLEHFELLFTFLPMATYFSNSLIVALAVTIFTLLISTYSAYILTRFKARGWAFISKLLILFYMIPDISLVIGFYTILRQLNLIDTYAGLCLAHLSITVPFCIWILKAYFAGIPVQLDEAAMIDGAGRIRTIVHVILPTAFPGILATGIYAFVTSWNEFTLASTLMLADSHKTLPVAMSILTTEGAFTGEIMAMSLVAMIPAMIGVAFVMRYLIAGLTAGALKY